MAFSPVMILREMSSLIDSRGTASQLVYFMGSFYRLNRNGCPRLGVFANVTAGERSSASGKEAFKLTPVKIRNLLAGVCLVAAMGLAQQSRINRPIDVNQRALVANQVHPKARAEFDQGRVAADFFVPFVTVTMDPTDK